MSRTKNRVYVDLDNTVHDFDMITRLAAAELYETMIHGITQEWADDMRKYLTDEECGRVYSRAHDDDFIEWSRPYPNCAKYLTRLSNDYDLEIWYISDRKSSAWPKTVEWLTKHGFPTPENLICSPDKRKELRDNADTIATVIDDRVRTLLFAKFELGIKDVFSIKHGYNRNLTDVDGIHLRENWNELYSALSKIIGAKGTTEQVAEYGRAYK